MSITFTTSTSSLPTCPLREEKSFSQRAFSIYTDIRKLQDKAKTSYTLSNKEVDGLALINQITKISYLNNLAINN